MLSAKDEKNAVWATLLFNVVHYAIRPWPWILIALASLIVFPELSDLAKAFPNLDASVVKDDLSYPAMLTYLPSGLLGLVLTSLVAAFMSTISTHLNWGSSYMINDFYQRFFRPKATSKELVLAARVSTVLLMFFAAVLALFLSSALQAFNILLQIGAGTGLLFILRWFWYRINAWSEITAMIVSFVLALYFQLIHTRIGFIEIPASLQLIIGIFITTIAWVSVTLLTKPSNDETLELFYRKIRPGGPGWKKIENKISIEEKGYNKDSEEWDVPVAILCMVVGSFMVFSMLFTIGYFIYGNYKLCIITSFLLVLSLYVLMKLWKKLRMN